MTPKSTPAGPAATKDRPFPWRCPKCGKQEVVLTCVSDSVDVNHDGRLYHIEIPDLQVPQCQSCGERLFTGRADDQISAALRAHLHLLTSAQIRAARTELGLSQKELAARLGTAEETVSRWATGAMIQSRAMDNLLRLFFALPAVRNALQDEHQDAGLGVKVCA